jgi:hypothetical protein
MKIHSRTYPSFLSGLLKNIYTQKHFTCQTEFKLNVHEDEA